MQKTLLLVLLLLSTSIFAKSDAILQLDTLGHTGKIKDILVSKDRQEIISASDDKTIRVWDVKSGKEKRKILGQIGAGGEGRIYAIALSSDNRYLAVGGFMGSYTGNKAREDEESNKIRIYNYHSGKLLKLLKSHTNVVLDLSFSSDDKYLVSGSGDKSVKVWRVSDWSLQSTIKTHTNAVYAVKMIKENGAYSIYSAGYDNKITLHHFKNGKSKYINSFTADYKLNYLAINKKDVATCGDGKEILIFDKNLHLKQRVVSQTEPSGLAYSPDGKSLVAGTSANPFNVNIYETKGYRKIATFKQHTNLTMAVNFIDERRVVSGGGTNNEIYIWDKRSTRVEKKIVGVGQSVWSVGIDGDNIAWGNIYCGNVNCQKFQKSINLKTFQLNSLLDKPRLQSQFKRVESSNGSYSLQHTKGGDYGYSDAVLQIIKDGVLQGEIVKDSTSGYRHNCYGWYKDFIISGGSNGHLKIYNKEGKEVASLVGHTGEVWSIAVDGDRLVSGSDDQTMKVWDLSQLRERSGDIRIVEANWFDKSWKSFINKNYPNIDINKKSHRLKLYHKLVEANDNDAKLMLVSKKIYPTLTIFVSKDNEYVAYTKEGFFTASKGGAKYIGYHINQGSNKEARYVSVDKLYDSYYRPDLIQKALNGEDLSKYAKGIDINTLLGSGLAPEVKIVTDAKYSKTRDLALELQVCTIDDGGYSNLTLYLDGMAVDVIGKDRALKLKKQSRTREDCFTLSKLISLTNGKNTIGFKATNRAGNIESNLDEIVVNYKGRSNKKPNLYILAIGVDKYRDGDLWLKYSKADALGFVSAIEKASKPLFKNIYTYKLLDKDATKSKMLAMFTRIGKKTTREDVFMLYMAGHGITDAKTGAYFYLPVDFRYKNENSVRESGMSQNDFKLALSKIQALKSLTILDTCNSGSFAEAMASRGVLQKTAINKLTRATGRATIVASSKDQVALEGYKGHGVFTYTLIEALKGKGYGSDDKITIKELAGYIEDVLPDRTYEKWGYEQVPQSNITGNDFPIGVR